MNYDECLNHIFKTYMEKKDSIKGLFYKDYKNPSLFEKLLINLQLIPDSQKVIRITGSKGKGSTARTLSSLLGESFKVGLFVSPEEIDHCDRIQIGEEIISKKKFCYYYKKVMVEMEKVTLGEQDYFSPYGLFLLIALSWFRDEEVDYFIIECGRGVRYDDSSQIPSSYGIITSIFNEHLQYFGDGIKDVWNDKSALLENSEKVFMPLSLSSYDVMDTKVLWVDDSETFEGFPKCYGTSLALSKALASHLLNKKIKDVSLVSSSYGEIKYGDKFLYFDGIIHSSGIDLDWIKSLPTPPLFLVSLPDDKDIEGVKSFLNQHHFRVTYIVLEGTRGYLDYKKTEGPIFHCDDSDALKRYWSRHPAQTIIFWGTQTFLRLFKKSLKSH